ncbi:MAG: polyprenyl synthetase family protein [Phycisphaerales bacterium]|nr:polyprenyl synthetase family protein [Phycisphaerales bacterium]
MSIIDAHGIDETLSGVLTSELARVTSIFENQLTSEWSPVTDLGTHVARYHGKMLRPTLVLLSGLAVSRESGSKDITEAHRIVAAVTEMIHLATLVHDDVLDESVVRRNGPTVNSIHGNEVAVMLGDYLISNAFHLCSTVGQPDLNVLLGKTTNLLCEGEIVQLYHRDDLTIDESVYLSIVERKTASLIATCCEVGAMLVCDEPKIRSAMHSFGLNLGVAFQITDDLLDLTGEQFEVGKSVGRDLDVGTLTLPFIRALQQSGEDDRRTLSALVRDRCHAQLRQRLRDEGWVDSALDTARELVKTARRQLEPLPDNAATSTLHRIADGVIDRKF